MKWRRHIGVAILLDRGQYHKADNLPTKVYEYMQKGLPVIIYNSEYVKRVLKEYKFGIAVDPENVDQIANAIKYLCTHPKEAIEMGRNGRRAVLEKYNWQKEEKKLIRLYAEILHIEGNLK